MERIVIRQSSIYRWGLVAIAFVAACDVVRPLDSGSAEVASVGRGQLIVLASGLDRPTAVALEGTIAYVTALRPPKDLQSDVGAVWSIDLNGGADRALSLSGGSMGYLPPSLGLVAVNGELLGSQGCTLLHIPVAGGSTSLEGAGMIGGCVGPHRVPGGAGSLYGLAVDASGLLFFDFPEGGLHFIATQPSQKLGYDQPSKILVGERYDFTGGAADGPGANARMSYPRGLALGDGHLYVADSGNHAIRAVNLATSEVTTLAGTLGEPGDADGIGSKARFREPQGIAWDRRGAVYVTDTGNHLVRKIDVASGAVTTVVGRRGRTAIEIGALPGGLDEPVGIAVTAMGALVITDRHSGEVLLARSEGDGS